MTAAHPYPTELLLAFASLPRREQITVAHVAACGRCKLEVPLPRAGGIEAGSPPLPHSWPLLDVLRELPPSRFAQERRPARSRLRELLNSPPDRWREQVQQQEKLHSPMFAWLLLSGSYELSFEDSLLAEELARLALAVADLLPAALDSTAARVESQGWVLVGHALTLRKARAEAESAFAEAVRRRPDRGPLEEALYCRFLAGLRRSEKRVPEALALLGRAIALFQEAECLGQEIAARNDLGVFLLALGERGAAFDALLRAFLLAEGWMSLDLALRCREGLARCALDLDRLDLARTLLEDRAADERRASRGARVHLGLARSTVQLRSASPEVAERTLLRVLGLAAQGSFIVEQLLATVLLAALLARQGRQGELAELLPKVRRLADQRGVDAALVEALTTLRNDALAGRLSLSAALDQTEALRRTANRRGDEVLATLAWTSALVDEYAHGRGAETVRPGGAA